MFLNRDVETALYVMLAIAVPLVFSYFEVHVALIQLVVDF